MRRAASDRGATVTEYALGVALVFVVSLGAINALGDSSEDHLESDGDRIGEVADGAYYASAGPTTTSPSGTSTTLGPTTAVHPSEVTASPPPSNSTSNKWIANATITILDSSNQPVGGVLVQGRWIDPTPVREVECTTTAPSGTCSVQRTDTNDNKKTATFEITAISGDGFSWTPGPGDATTVVVDCTTVAGIC